MRAKTFSSRQAAGSSWRTGLLPVMIQNFDLSRSKYTENNRSFERATVRFEDDLLHPRRPSHLTHDGLSAFCNILGVEGIFGGRDDDFAQGKFTRFDMRYSFPCWGSKSHSLN